MNGGTNRKQKSILAKLRAYVVPILLFLALCFTVITTGIGLFVTSERQHTYQAVLKELYTAPPEIGQRVPNTINNNATISKKDATIVRTFRTDETYLTMFGAHKVQESLSRLPKWLQDYVEWHAEQRKKPISECKFLIVPCFYGNKCGGTSDRLRPLPYWLLLSKLTERVLIIKWDKPHDLHEFLVPPAGGLDWRSFPEIDERVIYGNELRLQNKFKLFWADTKSACGVNVSVANCTINKIVPRIRDEANEEQFVMVSLVRRERVLLNQLNLFMQQFSYDKEMPEIGQWGYAEMFGDIFRVMFEPVPALAYKINQTMTSLGLREGEYVSTHVRARYPVAMKRSGWDQFRFEGEMKDFAMKLSNNAIDCGHFLSPDLPVLFVSDSHHLTNFWSSIGTKSVQNNVDVAILAVNRSEEPLHIDRDDIFPGSKPSDFFSGFEDLLMMGGSKCVSHGVGSFGSFGSGLIGNKCSNIHRKHNGHPASCPNTIGERKLVPIDPMLKKLAMPEYM